MKKLLGHEEKKQKYSKIKKALFGFLLLLFFTSFIFTSYVQAESVVLRVIAVNPSEKYPQKVPVRIFLPKEAKPEDIIDKEDLSVGYDTQQGSYYVYGEYELKPKETLEKNIELRDIWVISVAEIESLRLEAEKSRNLLKNTEFADRINFLYNSIVTKIDEIIERQKVKKPNPEDHISEYRYNLQLIESIKADLSVVRSMLNKAKPLSVKTIWKLMIFILIFLGVLGLSFYFLWHKQVVMNAENMPEDQEHLDEFKTQEESKDKQEEKETEDENI